jgi:hypothetical protein
VSRKRHVKAIATAPFLIPPDASSLNSKPDGAGRCHSPRGAFSFAAQAVFHCCAGLFSLPRGSFHALRGARDRLKSAARRGKSA